MSDFATRELAAVLAGLDNDEMGDLRLRRGVVTAVTTTAATVRIGGADIANVPVYRDLSVKVNDTVDVLFDGPAPRIVGVISALGPQGLVAFEIVDSANRRGYGRYANVRAADIPTTQTVTTTQTWTEVGVLAVPALPGRFYRARYHFPAGGPVNTSTEWYFYLMVSVNGGTYTQYQEVRYAPAGGNAPSPEGEAIFISPTNASTLGVSVDVRISGGTGTLWKYSTINAWFRSHLTLEDLGPS